MQKLKRYLSAAVAMLLLLASFPLFVSASDWTQETVVDATTVAEPYVAESEFASELSAEPQPAEDEPGPTVPSVAEPDAAEGVALAAGTTVPNDVAFEQDAVLPDATADTTAAATATDAAATTNEDSASFGEAASQAASQEPEALQPSYTSFTYESDDLALKAYVTSDSWFGTDSLTVSTSMLELVGAEEENDAFANLVDAYDGEVHTVDLAFQTESGKEVEQLSGTTYLAMRIPTEDEHAVIEDVRIYRDTEDGNIERVEDIYVNEDDAYVLFDAGKMGSYAFCYTVDYYYEDQEYHMYGGSTMLLSELFDQLGIHRAATDVEDIDFTDESLIGFTRYDDNSDWVIKSLAPFSTEEVLTLAFADGYKLRIDVTDAGIKEYSTDLNQFMTDWKIKVGDTVYSDDTCYPGMEIEYTDGMVYTFELRFAEKADLEFDTPPYDPDEPAPQMTYQLPDCFDVPSDFQTTLNVNLGLKGTLPNNIISVTKGYDDDGNPHSYLTVTWNWKDSHWEAFRDSAQAKLKISVNGTFTGKNPDTLYIKDKEITIRRADLHNAIVSKTGKLDKATNEIYYTVSVKSQGTTSNITLTDQLGSALTYLWDADHGGGVAWDEEASTNEAGTTPIITAHSGNTFYVEIPNMNDEDELVFHYFARVDYDEIEISGNPTFEETGNTATIVGDSYILDNVAKYHETDVSFSDLEKNCTNKQRISVGGVEHYDLTWEIKTNRRADYPLAGTEIKDIISEDVQAISAYYDYGVTIQCYDEGGVLQDTRGLSWDDLGVDLATDKSWVYTVPETDPNYCYVLTYHTLVDMSEVDESVVITNTAEGKGGIDSDAVVLTPSGTSGFGISKKATNVSSTHVTWEITLTVSGTALESRRICLTEHSETDSNTKSWSRNTLPYRSWDLDGDKQTDVRVSERLQKVEVEGLEGNETFKVSYGREGDSRYFGTYISGTPENGKTVLEDDFIHNPWGGNYFQLEFYQDENQQTGGLITPDEESPTRTIVVRLTTEFDQEWANTAQQVVNASAKRSSYDFEHVNWIAVDAAYGNDTLVNRGKDTAKIMPMPLHVNKMVLRNEDTTASSVLRDFFLLDYPAAKQESALSSPNCYGHLLFDYREGNATGKDPQYAGLISYPTFHYMVYVTGLEYDEPIVIEDAFDTSLFEVITPNNLRNCQIITETSRKWTNNFYPTTFGMSKYRSWTPDSNFDGTYTKYFFGYNGANGKAEDHSCTLELTETGFTVTIKEPMKQADGSLYPVYGIEYWLVPKDLDALKRIETTAKVNALAGGEQKASYTNTVKCRGTEASATVKIGVDNDFVPLDKTSEAYLKLMAPVNGSDELQLQKDSAGRYVTPDTVGRNDIKHYEMRYTITLNKGCERLNDGANITVLDRYSDTLSVDFHTIKVTTVPAEAASKVSYDFSGNVGTFVIPDETFVTIEYDAIVLQTGVSDDVQVGNTVEMLNYSKSKIDDVQYGGTSESEAADPAILLKKYGTGHMERGLNGAKFQLFIYNHDYTYNKGVEGHSGNAESDWIPVTYTTGDKEGEPVYFTTEHLILDDVDYGDGYALIHLSASVYGSNLKTGTTYGLREVETPTYKTSDDPNTTDDIITYKPPHGTNFYCYVFTICGENETADYGNYVFFDQDTMTVRNTPESTSLHMNKEIVGNAKDLLSETEKDYLWYQLYRKRNAEDDVYWPIMTHDDVNDCDVIDSRFDHITYDRITGTDGSGGMDLAGLVVQEGAYVGEYLLVEYGNNRIMGNHPDWTWHGSYRWEDDDQGSFTNSAYTVCDVEGHQSTAKGVTFTVTTDEVKNGEWKSVTIVNSYDRETVDLKAEKRWIGPTGLGITWPTGKQVTFELGTLVDTTDNGVDDPEFRAMTGYRIVLDDVADANGESIPGQAKWKALPKNEVVENADGTKSTSLIRYAVREVGGVEGYTVVYPQIGDHEYAEFDTHGETQIQNQVQSTSISVTKLWDQGRIPAAATATFRLYAYVGIDPSYAYWVSNVNDIVLDGIPDAGESTFGEKTPWKADFTGLPRYDSNGVQLTYIVKELSCTPTNYEPVEEYAENGSTITNKPASTVFTVRKAWSDTPGDAWPEGYEITFELSRKTRAGSVDNSFSATYVVSADALVSQDPFENAYGEVVQTGVWNSSSSVLSVFSLPKYDDDGNEWLYFARETAVVDEEGASVMDLFSCTYRDKKNYPISEGYAYSGGSVTNVHIARDLTLSKTVEGNMGDRTKEFTFTIMLTKANGQPYNNSIVVEDSLGTSQLVPISGVETVTLKHGESVTLKDLPSSLRYTITESETDAGDYVTSYVVDDGAPQSGRSVTGTLSANTSIAFTNMREVVLPMGVYLPTGAYLAAVPFALQGWWVARRRKRRESEPEELHSAFHS